MVITTSTALHIYKLHNQYMKEQVIQEHTYIKSTTRLSSLEWIFFYFLLGTDQNFLVLSGFKNQTKENMTLPFPSPHSGKKDHSDLYVQPSHTV